MHAQRIEISHHIELCIVLSNVVPNLHTDIHVVLVEIYIQYERAYMHITLRARNVTTNTNIFGIDQLTVMNWIKCAISNISKETNTRLLEEIKAFISYNEQSNEEVVSEETTLQESMTTNLELITDSSRQL